MSPSGPHRATLSPLGRLFRLSRPLAGSLNFTVCTEQVRSPYNEHAVSGLPNPTRLEGGGGYDLSRLKTSRCYHM